MTSIDLGIELKMLALCVIIIIVLISQLISTVKRTNREIKIKDETINTMKLSMDNQNSYHKSQCNINVSQIAEFNSKLNMIIGDKQSYSKTQDTNEQTAFKSLCSKIDELGTKFEASQFLERYLFGVSLEIQCFNYIMKNIDEFKNCGFTAKDVFWNIFPEAGTTNHQTDIVINTTKGLLIIECKNLRSGVGDKSKQNIAYSYDVDTNEFSVSGKTIPNPVTQVINCCNAIYSNLTPCDELNLINKKSPAEILFLKKIILLNENSNNKLKIINNQLCNSTSHLRYTRFSTIDELSSNIKQLLENQKDNSSFCSKLSNALEKIQSFNFQQ